MEIRIGIHVEAETAKCTKLTIVSRDLLCFNDIYFTDRASSLNDCRCSTEVGLHPAVERCITDNIEHGCGRLPSVRVTEHGVQNNIYYV